MEKNPVHYTQTHNSHHRCIPFDAAHSLQALIIYLSGSALRTSLIQWASVEASRPQESSYSLLFTLSQRQEPNRFLYYSKTIFQ